MIDDRIRRAQLLRGQLFGRVGRTDDDLLAYVFDRRHRHRTAPGLHHQDRFGVTSANLVSR